VTPLASRGPRARSLVLSAAEPIELRLRALSSPLELEIDGHERSVAHRSRASGSTSQRPAAG
jgi:hypothetical protein